MRQKLQAPFTAMLMMLSCWTSSAIAEAPLMKLVQTIPLDGVEGRFDHFAVDTEAKRLYIAALGNDSVEVIDIVAGKRLQSVTGPKKPTGIRVLPSSGKVVVASGDDGQVRVYDAAMKLLGSVDKLDDADNVRLDPAGKVAYVGYGSAVAVIDPEAPKVVTSIKFDGHPEAFQLETNGPRIFVNVPTSKHIAVINREKQAVIAIWPLQGAAANFPMALDEAHHRLFIGCRKPAKVLVVDTETGKTVGSVDCCGDTDDLFYDADAKRLYVTGGEGSISTIQCDEAHRYRLLGNTPTAPGARTSLYAQETHRLYVAVPHRGAQRAELRVYEP
jgi:DNA-binding beta-propeller fold protein YncE